MGNHNKYYKKKRSLIAGGLVVVTAILYLGQSVPAQRGLIAEKFLKIIPGLSVREDVERRFPAAASDEFRQREIFNFKDKEFAIFIDFSTGKCGDSIPDFGRLPKGTVIEISYVWPNDDQVPLAKVILDTRKFEKKHLGDVTIHDTYVNEEFGIAVVYDTKRKSVIGVDLTPPAKLVESHQCP